MSKQPAFKIMLSLAPIVLTFVSTTLILLLAGANPLKAYSNLASGAFESPKKLADIAVAMVPLLLCSAGMLVTFSAGLWNIGVEGQMIAGALMTTWCVRSLSLPLFPTGLLRTHGHVNEIFAGLGLNFIAAALTNYLIFGPWKPPDGATMSGTDPFPQQAWMPLLGTTRLSPLALTLAALAIVAIYFLLRDTYWGLKLKAIGLNARSAYRLGVNTSGNMLLAFAVCGALAGLAGSLQATAVYHRLIPQISGGYGYLSQLVVLLSGLNAQWVPLIVFFFAAVQVGSPRLDLRMQLDSSLGGVLQTSIVLFFLLVRGWRQRIMGKN